MCTHIFASHYFTQNFVLWRQNRKIFYVNFEDTKIWAVQCVSAICFHVCLFVVLSWFLIFWQFKVQIFRFKVFSCLGKFYLLAKQWQKCFIQYAFSKEFHYWKHTEYSLKYQLYKSTFGFQHLVSATNTSLLQFWSLKMDCKKTVQKWSISKWLHTNLTNVV